MVEIGEIGREGSDVLVRKRGKAVDNGRHRPGSAAVQDADAIAQVAEQLVLRPRHGSGVGSGQRRRDPVVDHRAGVGVAALFRTEQVARGMTRAAVAQAPPRDRPRDSIQQLLWASGSKRPGRKNSNLHPACR